MNTWLLASALLLCMVVAALLWLVKQQSIEPVTLAKRKKKQTNYQEQLNEWWQRAGFSRSPAKNLVLALLLATNTYLSDTMLGLPGAMLGATLTMLVLFALAQWRRSNIKRRLIQQLPSFIDQVNRRIKVGMSIAKAVEQSAKTTSKPLSLVLDRVNHRKNIGIELQDAFYKESVITGVKPFRLLGSIFNINARFGGSITDPLDSLVQLLRQQDLSQRELKSITGETRITAWVIGIAPTMVGIYMMSQNPELLVNMWQSDSGRHALLFGLGLQTTGIFMIWRMFRSL